jgi:hypothetical protein
MNNTFSDLWRRLTNPQKLEFWKISKEHLEIWKQLGNPDREDLWEQLEDLDREGLWKLLKDSDREDLWEQLEDPDREGLWKLLEDPDREGLWKLLEDPDREGLWKLLEDPDKEGLWKLLKDPRRKALWELLKDDQKAILLEILSRPYSLSHIVFSLKKFVENKLKEDNSLQAYNFTNVYISLEEFVGTPSQSEPTACVITRIKEYNVHKTLYIKIQCDTRGKSVEYDQNSCISKQCSRFLVGHEVAHIILDINSIVENSIEGKQLPPMSPVAEKEANFFAYILSDLRDLHILKKHHDEIFPSEEIVANSYKAKIEEQKDINPDKIINCVLNLNSEAKKFTMSNSILAVKKVMNVIYNESLRRVSLIYPNKTTLNTKTVTQIECFKPEEGNESSFGYAITLPTQDSELPNLDKDSCCIAKAIGAILLDYDTIKKKELEKLPNLIPVDNEIFSMERLQNFADCLLRIRKKHLSDFAVEKIKSKNRIINMK